MQVLKTSTLAVVIWALSMGAVAEPSKPRVFQASPVVNAESMEEVGAAWLRRSTNRVDGRIMTTVDLVGIPYTVWWVVFNNPAGCLAECGPDDVTPENGGKAAKVAVFYASGAISAASGENGVINLDLSVIGRERAGKGAQVPPPPAAEAPQWNRILKKNNGRCAEIHLDINVHDEPPVPVNWVSELTYPRPPGSTESFAVFKPAPGCK